MSKVNQQGFTPILILIILLIGLGVGLYLVKNPTFLKPRANAESIQVLDGNCVSLKDGVKQLTCGNFQFKIVAPNDTGN